MPSVNITDTLVLDIKYDQFFVCFLYFLSLTIFFACLIMLLNGEEKNMDHHLNLPFTYSS